mmetsp:Transcript_6351/g.14064  ORF Transcript_6351/g.14064 Transcript_6351/m.14064 type:complete len:469 (+) Transcript_6351:20-1426(+)|eukprot:CAMPEP_0202893892 /NCGR_PEP_ID=MMETSP1392-20130828/3380_1 /ASSEMBLY_ACC=CAM_ASM_000868 /TAXON_ID=225041 /ORGANISM="Chlamydomonas chlamydogama, Strain SAG 11-48b" /LENGTH=468 /DNA_ID=CAMNT_0049578385 /DNA_START=20 /DNA_END=1426 /DNA_ORIENTATION=-
MLWKWPGSAVAILLVLQFCESTNSDFRTSTSIEHHVGRTDAGKDLKDGIKNPRPLIYVYDLPKLAPEFRNYTFCGDYSDTNYGFDQVFPALLFESPYITTDPDKADYFYAHIWLFWPGASRKLDPVIDAIREAGPWWDRKNGSDHIFIATADQGRCEYRRYPRARHAIFIQHFGGTFHHATLGCPLHNMWGGECDREFMLNEAMLRGEDPWLCHYPGQDIVVPTSAFERHDNANDHDDWMSGKITKPRPPPTPYTDAELNPNDTANTRNTKFFFIGHIQMEDNKDDPWRGTGYSFGARQTVFKMFHKHAGYQVTGSYGAGSSYWQSLSRSMYCLAVAGYGWSGRFKNSINRGCVPVIVQDGNRVEFEEQLPMQDIAVRLPMWMVHKMPSLLDWLTHIGKLGTMRKNIDFCAWRLFWWRRPYGRAFEVLMCELKRRALNAPKIQVRWETCEIECGDGNWINLKDGFNHV